MARVPEDSFAFLNYERGVGVGNTRNTATGALLRYLGMYQEASSVKDSHPLQHRTTGRAIHGREK